MSPRKKEEGKARKAKAFASRLQRPSGREVIQQKIAESKQAADDKMKAMVARSTVEVNEHTTKVVEAEHKDTRVFVKNTMNDMTQALIAKVRSEVRSEMRELMTPQRPIPSAVSVGEASSTVPDIHRRESFLQTPSRRASSLELEQENKDLREQLRYYTTPAKCPSNFKANETPLYHSEVPKIDEEIRRKAEGRCKEAKKKANMPLSESSRPTTRSRARNQASKL